MRNQTACFGGWSTERVCARQALSAVRPETHPFPPDTAVARPLFPLRVLLVCACLCAFVCIFVCWKKKKHVGRRSDSVRKKRFLYEHAVVVAMLIIFFKSLFFLIFTIVLPLSLISVVRFKCLFTFYGSFCSIPLPLLLRRGLFTINLLVFLFTEQFLIHTHIHNLVFVCAAAKLLVYLLRISWL